MDEAFELIKKMPFSSFVTSKLDDIFDIYIEQKTIEFWKKAYEVTFFWQKFYEGPFSTEQNRAVIQTKLDQIFLKCLDLNIPASEEFLNQILKHYPKCVDISSKESYKPLSLKEMEDKLIARGNMDVIRHRNVEKLVKGRKFNEAIDFAVSIKKTEERINALSLIWVICCEFGDVESIKIALEIVNQPDLSKDKNSYLLSMMFTCKKK